MIRKTNARLYTLVAVLSLLLVQCNVVMQLRYNSLRSLMNFTGYGEPRWSPDGTQIIFTDSSGGIIIIDSDGTHRRSLKNQAGPGYTPDWSPDGKEIVFASRRSGQWQIYVVNTDGSNVAQVTRLTTASYPRWSPDGRRIAFCKLRDTKEGEGIYVMDEDGTNISQLTHYPLQEACNLAWSPDSTQIVFSAANALAINQGKGIPDNWDEYGPHLYVMNADGSNLRRVNKGIGGSYYPTWSPDGKQILTSIEGKPMWGGFYLVDLDGSEGRKVFDASSCNQLHWSWTTNRLLYVCLTGLQTTQLYTVDMKEVLK